MQTKNEIPQSLEAETGTLGSILIDTKAFPLVRGILEPDDFYDSRHREIFQMMVELNEKESKIDMLTVGQKLKDKKLLEKIGGRAYLMQLTEETPTSSHAEAYAKIIKEKSLARKIIKGGSELFQVGFDGSVADAEAKMLDTLQRLNENKNETDGRKIKDILKELETAESEGTLRGLDTGIGEIDQITVGLKAGHFWIIGGEYKSGKSRCALEIARRAARTHRVLFYTLEMNDDEVVSILLQQERRNKTKKEAVDAVAALDENLIIYDDKYRLAQLEAHILSQEKTPTVVFIDHIGLITTDDKEPHVRLSRVSRSLKLLAKRTGTCIVSLSQISEESIKRKAGSFKGSGDIAADCDVGMVVIKDNESELDEVRFVIDVRFNRHGRRKKIDLFFDNTRGVIMFNEDLAEQQAVSLALPDENLEDLLPILQ